MGQQLAHLVERMRPLPYDNIPYSNLLYCHRCGLPALIRYVQFRRCQHIVCVFCKHTHNCEEEEKLPWNIV